MKRLWIFSLASMLLGAAVVGCQGTPWGGCPGGNCGLRRGAYSNSSYNSNRGSTYASPGPGAPPSGGSGTR